MKKIMLACTILLSACSDAPTATVADLQNALEGRWLFNSAYCEQLLPDDGFIDHVIVKEGILTGGVLANGQWYRPTKEEAAVFADKVELFIEANSDSCKEPLPTGSPLFIVFESFEQKFVLAYYRDSDAVFRIVADEVIAGRRYDGESLSRLGSPYTE
jgi:hypothetical protein